MRAILQAHGGRNVCDSEDEGFFAVDLKEGPKDVMFQLRWKILEDLSDGFSKAFIYIYIEEVER